MSPVDQPATSKRKRLERATFHCCGEVFDSGAAFDVHMLGDCAKVAKSSAVPAGCLLVEGVASACARGVASCVMEHC